MATPARRQYKSVDDDLRSLRRIAIRDDLNRRLRKVCSYLSDDEFRALIETMADRQLRSERRGSFF